VNRRSRRAR